jgi:hypothetical protein
MITYEIVDGDITTPQIIKATLENGVIMWIPCDPANSDYQAYLNKDKPVEHFTPMVTDADKS